MNIKKIFYYALGPLGSALIGFITLPIITWFYSVEDIGRIAMLQVISSLVVLIFCLGLDQSYIREYYDCKDKPGLFKQTFMPGFLILLIASCLLYLIDPGLISVWLYNESSEYLSLLSMLGFILVFCSKFFSLIVRMEERALAYSVSQLLPKVAFLLFIIVGTWFGFEKNIINLISVHVLAILITFVVFLWNVRVELVKSFKVNFDFFTFIPLLKFGFPLVIAMLASWGLNVMDRFFLRGLSTFYELGVYSVTMSISGGVVIISSIFNFIWAPLVYKWVNEDKVDFKKIDTISEHILAISFFLVVLSGLFSWVLQYLLPPKYSAIQYLISVSLIGPLFYTLSEITAVGLMITRKVKYSMYASLLAMIVNAAGNYLLIPLFGASGAAVATAISFWIFYILRTEFSKNFWRDINTKKTYLLMTLVLAFSIFNCIFLYSNRLALIIWFLLLLLGGYCFRYSIITLYYFLMAQYKGSKV